MGALTRFRAYFQNMWNQKVYTYPEFCYKFPVDLLGLVPGLTSGNANPVTPSTWSSLTTYTVNQKVTRIASVYISLQNGNTNHLPESSPTWWSLTTPDYYPAQAGESSGEIFLATNVAPPQTFIWYSGTWYPLGGTVSGGGGTLSAASTTVLGGVYTWTTPTDPSAPKVMILVPAAGPVTAYFDANSARISNLLNPVSPQDAVTVSYLAAENSVPILSEPDAASTGLYREITGGAFPTAIIWWTNAGKTVKVKEILLTYDGNNNVTQEVYKFYKAGVLSSTYTDVITLSGAFETSRARTIT
jgi:hypothetical protein